MATAGNVKIVQPGTNLEVVQAPAPIPGVPQGLEYLTGIDQLIVQQQIELLEIFTGFETNNKYVITNSLGQQCYFALENTDCLMRQCCKGNRAFEMSILTNTGQEALHFSRPLKCGCCWGPASCFHQLSATVSGVPVGYVKQRFSLCKPSLDILNGQGEKVLQIDGPCCPCGCVDIPFVVSAPDGTKIGNITKQWRGCLAECCTKADRFGITFPMDLDVTVKATLMGAMFLIDFMFFEENKE